ncbi:MAG TPA: gamma-glutamyltransferase [Terriglobales bacterium]|nr:gamma-glutamyltransferase [Terriglobales bacterium]
MQRSYLRRLSLLVLLCELILSGSAQEVSQSGLELKAQRSMVEEPERAPKAMIASANQLASQAGLSILRKGGNAVDAAVAVAFALAVVHPEAGNLGGGGYMLIRMADGTADAIDYKETAPAAAHPGMFTNKLDSTVGYKASAVPGTVAGMGLAHSRFGKLPWKEVLEPARKLAKDGFPASQRMEIILALQAPVMKQFPESASTFLHGSDQPLKQGEFVKQPDLSATIARIQKHGWREFYEGKTARLIDSDMAAHDGTIRYDDLKSYKAIERNPVKGTFRENQILSMPPSSSGGTTLIEMLNIFETFPAHLGMEGSSEQLHHLIESMRRAFKDRAEYSADPAFFSVPIDLLTSKEHARELASSIQPDRATPSTTSQVDTSPHEGEDTTHFSIIDESGNIVSNTYTLNSFYGSQVTAAGTGVLLNDIMSAFSSKPGERGDIKPGKRPISSMTPTIVLHPDGSPWFALGSPGSATIPNTVFQIIVNVVDSKMSLRDAIEFPRIHHQYLPDRVDAEPGALVFDVAKKLQSFGDTLNPKLRSQGDVHAVMVEEGSGWRLGWSDGRRGGRAVGY